MAKVARSVRVCGRVQGVFYRAWTCQRARELGVMGWVWNLHNGSVEARLEGEEEAVERLIHQMREGPPGAQVTDLEFNEVELENLDYFDVRPTS